MSINIKIKKAIIYIATIVLSVCMEYIYANQFSYTVVHINGFNTFQTLKAFANVFSLNLLILIIIITFNKRVIIDKVKTNQKILAMLFSIFMIIGNSYFIIGNWNLVFGNYLVFLLSIVLFFGYYNLFKDGIGIFNNYLNKKEKEEIKSKRKILHLFDEHPFIISLLVILVGWLIYMVAFYPIILSPDPSYQIIQFFNVPNKYIDWVIRISPTINMTTHHPIIHTYLLGGCLTLGRNLINDNFGLFLYSLIQIAILSSTLAYTIYYLKKNGIASKYRMLLLLVYTLVPMFPLYAMSAVKDTIYTALVILYVISLFEITKFYSQKRISLKYAIYITFILLLVSLFRNNGIYLIVLSFPILILLNKINRWKLTIVFLIFYSCLTSFNKILIPRLGISGGSIREVLSIPFQQTARYTKYYSQDLTPQEIKTIDYVLGYNTLASRYNPELADPVKNEYNKYVTSKELTEYFKVWYNGLIKHPFIYIEATLNNTYGYVYPNKTNWYIYNKYYSRITEGNLVDYHYNNLQVLRNKLSIFGLTFPYSPIVGLISNIGFNCWLVLLLALSIWDKNKRYFVVIMPLLATLLICIASPANAYFRYTMPYIFIMPFSTILFINLFRSEKNGKIKK